MPVTRARSPGVPGATIESADARRHADAAPGACAGAATHAQRDGRRRRRRRSRRHRTATTVHRHDHAFADEPRHRRVGRLAIELRRRRELQHAALVHHRDAIGERHRFGLVVRDVDHRRAGALVEVARTRAPSPRADARRDWRAARRAARATARSRGSARAPRAGAGRPTGAPAGARRSRRARPARARRRTRLARSGSLTPATVKP